MAKQLIKLPILPVPYPRPPRPYPIPFPLPPEYISNIHPCPDRQDYEIVYLGVIYDGKTGTPKIDLNFTY